MAELRQRAGFAGEALGKIQVAAGTRRQDFQRDEPVQRRLARLIDRAHAALADEFEDFELGKKFGEVGNGGRRERRRAGRRAAFGRDAALQQAGRAKPFRARPASAPRRIAGICGEVIWVAGATGRRGVLLFSHLAQNAKSKIVRLTA